MNKVNFTLRSKYRIAIFVWIVGGSILLLGTLYLTQYLLIPLIIVTFIIGGYSLSLKCPICGKPVLHNRVKIFGLELNIWTSWIPKRCTRCGNNFA